MNNILLFSGWQTCNIGDIGHTFGTLRYLEKWLPEASVTVCLLCENEPIRALLKKRFPKAHVLCADYADLTYPSQLLRVFESSDLIIQNSGMHYNTIYNLEPVLARACIEHKKPWGLYGQSFDGFGDSTEIPQLLTRAAFIFCRDSQSIDYLKTCHVTPRILEFGPDGCFGIDVRDDCAAATYLEKTGLIPGKFMTITLRSNSPNLHAGSSSILNPADITKEHALENRRWADKLIEIITQWVERTGQPVLLAPEVDKEIANAHRLIWGKLPTEIRNQVICRDTFWSVDEAASIYAQARVLVSMEPHSCIIGLANGVPAIHYYSPKHGVKANMFDDIGLGKWLHNIDTDAVENVLEPLFDIIENPDRAREEVQMAMTRVHNISNHMIDVIREELLSSSTQTLDQNKELSCA